MSESLETRFWRFVTKGDGCWEWTGGTSGKDGRAKFGTMRAARVVWVLTYGAIPEGMWVLHHCDNPMCVRPDHLFLGTPKDNMVDKVSKGRGASGEKHGRARATEEMVRSIRTDYATGTTTLKALGAKHGLPFQTIYSIITRQSWKQVL